MFHNDKVRLIACAEFASAFIGALCQRDINKVSTLIDENETGMELDYLVSGAGDIEFQEIESMNSCWSFHILPNKSKSFNLEFNIPFKGEYRPAMSKFSFIEIKPNTYKVIFVGFEPS